MGGREGGRGGEQRWGVDSEPCETCAVHLFRLRETRIRAIKKSPECTSLLGPGSSGVLRDRQDAHLKVDLCLIADSLLIKALSPRSRLRGQPGNRIKSTEDKRVLKQASCGHVLGGDAPQETIFTI